MNELAWINYGRMLKYETFWNCCQKKGGYSGVAIFTKFKPISVFHGIGIDEHDKEGRVLTMEFDKFYIVSCYTPNSGEVCLINNKLNNKLIIIYL